MMWRYVSKAIRCGQAVWGLLKDPRIPEADTVVHGESKAEAEELLSWTIG